MLATRLRRPLLYYFPLPICPHSSPASHHQNSDAFQLSLLRERFSPAFGGHISSVYRAVISGMYPCHLFVCGYRKLPPATTLFSTCLRLHPQISPVQPPSSPLRSSQGSFNEDLVTQQDIVNPLHGTYSLTCGWRDRFPRKLCQKESGCFVSQCSLIARTERQILLT